MTKIIIRISKPYVSISDVLLVLLNSKTNKVQSRKLSFAVMENFDTEFIAPLRNEKKSIEDVSLILQDMYPSKSELSIKSLKLFCAKMEYQRGYSEISLTTWLQRQSKKYVLEAGIIRCIRCNSAIKFEN